MTLKYCTHAYLVGLDHEIPSDPSVAYDGTSPIIGCNHIVCDRCGAVARHVDGRVKTSNYPPPAAVALALYESSDPASSPLLGNGPLHAKSRAYLCRCDWGDVHLGGVKSLGSIDAMWGCGGHDDDPNAAKKAVPPPQVVPPPQAVAQPPMLRLFAQTSRPHAQPSSPPKPPTVLPAPAPSPPAVAKINLKYASTVNPEFATASELRDCLLASYPAAEFFGAPLIGGVNWDDTIPAWGWVADLIRMRSDWWPPLGKALEHATRDGGDMARRALADFCAGFNESLALLPWTSKIAASWPDVRASSSGLRLESIIRDQMQYVADFKSPDVVLDGYAKGGKAIRAKLTNEDELRVVLAESARAGRFHKDGTVGPWSWLGLQLLTREWMWDALVRVVKTIDAEPEISAALDWFSEERDLWRFQHVLAGWHANPPAWSSTAVTSKPRGWQRKMRVRTWHEPERLGDVATQALWRAVKQHATPPIIDLP